MPADRAKVLAALNAKFKGKSVDKNYKEGIATKWAAKITDDEAIDDFINDREDDVLEYMKAKDAAVTTATAKAKQDAADAIAGKKPDTQDTTTTGSDALPADTPEWVKTIMKQQKELAEKVAGFEQAKTTETLTQKFHKSLKDAGVPDNFIKYAPIPKEESEIEALQAQIVADAKPFIEQAKTAGFGLDTPTSGGVQKLAGTGKVDSDLVSFAKAKNEAVTTK